MNNGFDTIYLAPHLDDAVLSCGGQIFEETQRGERVLVVTLMAGDPPSGLSGYAESLHQRWQLAQNAAAARRREDEAACAVLGAEALHWDVPDCIYRADPSGAPLYLSDGDIFGPVHPADRPLVKLLATRLAGLPPARRWVAPLTVGHHVDHQLTRQAAERAFGSRLLYYEDFPYVQTPGSLDFLQHDAPNEGRWAAEVVPLSEAALPAKVAAILAYNSQLSTFFTGRADLERQVYGYAATVGGERLWRLR
ncbi:MAG: PIG-L family deacetylase [Anaerolineae bacterium]